ncbi:MAG: thermonuclease family protein [Dehalococcoidia bacterium]|nr:thermonuclease family protein [Dehalococcoidia bacterium]
MHPRVLLAATVLLTGCAAPARAPIADPTATSPLPPSSATVIATPSPAIATPPAATGSRPPASTATVVATPPAAQLPACQWATATRVVDGDTIVVTINGAEDRVRYIGVDTPETVAPGEPVQPFGPEASALNRALVQGKQVCLEKDITNRDRYGRLLRYAWLADGRLVNEELLLAGLATVVTYPPDVKYVESRYLPAQRAAREAGRGIWAGSAFAPIATATRAAVNGLFATPAPAAAPACYRPGANGCDCRHFATHAAAQAFHDTFDPRDDNRLDADNDGLACETLP